MSTGFWWCVSGDCELSPGFSHGFYSVFTIQHGLRCRTSIWSKKVLWVETSTKDIMDFYNEFNIHMDEENGRWRDWWCRGIKDGI